MAYSFPTFDGSTDVAFQALFRSFTLQNHFQRLTVKVGMSFAVAVSPPTQIFVLMTFPSEAHRRLFRLSRVLFYGNRFETGQFFLCRHLNSPVSPNGSCYGSCPFVGHFCVSLFPNPSPTSMAMGLTLSSSQGDSIL